MLFGCSIGLTGFTALDLLPACGMGALAVGASGCQFQFGESRGLSVEVGAWVVVKIMAPFPK